MVQGQMLENTVRGKLLTETIKKFKPKIVVEIGTWKGMGSTICIINSIEKDTDFFTLETNKEFYEIAKINLSSYADYFKLIYGRIVESADLNNFIKNKILSEEEKKWFIEDISNLEKCPNVLHLIPEKIDFLLLDGGEFSTFSEWDKLKDRVKIVALDDINSLKCKEIYENLTMDSNYELLSQTNEGNGFSVFKKKV